MSQKYSGGFITKSPVAPTSSAASGIWTLDQQQQAQKAGTWPSPPIFIEDLFSTFLYTGTSAAQTITNGIDLSGQGGLVWTKDRNNVVDHILVDTVRGNTKVLNSNNSTAEQTTSGTSTITGFNSNGYGLGTDGNVWVNTSGRPYVSWTFREQPKFFDVVTYTGNGAASRNIAHNLGSVPGCIICKALSISESWGVYHRSTGANGLYLNAINSAGVTGVPTGHTSTTFEVADGYGLNNASGVPYVAYLFAHDAGGFPVSGGGSTNAISCGSYAGNGSTTGPLIDLGYEPQWVMIKKSAGGTFSTGSSSWVIFDIMRGFTNSDENDNYLNPNLPQAENNLGTSNFCRPLSTGFQPTSGGNLTNENGATYIYIAIRRGPMKPPTVGTSVFGAQTWTGTSGSPRTFTSANWTFPTDLVTVKATNTATWWNVWGTRLTGGGTLSTNDTGAELSSGSSVAGYVSSFNQTGYTAITGTSSINNYNNSGDTYVSYNMRRAPGFFDTVCYTGDGADNRTVTNNLGVAAELIICKCRSTAGVNWLVGIPSISSGYLVLDATTSIASVGTNFFASSSTNISFPVSASQNTSTRTYIAYLFATTAGVSKVGSYTGTGALQTINCGFTSGARFVMIKRTDSTGGWYYYDSVRGITSGSDPYLFFNVSDAEVTGSNFVDTDTTGFQVTAAAPAAINANGGTFIFLAIA
jgi:hypothetical protein